VLRRARLCVWGEGERLNQPGARATRVLVLLRGSVRVVAPGGRPAAAGPGALLCAWPVLLAADQLSALVAATIVLAYAIPFEALQARLRVTACRFAGSPARARRDEIDIVALSGRRCKGKNALPSGRVGFGYNTRAAARRGAPRAQDLMARYASVGSGAWQACGASLALRHGGPELEHLSYNELQELFRRASRACQEHEKSASNVHRLSASQLRTPSLLCSRLRDWAGADDPAGMRRRRQARVGALSAGARLRVAGSAFLVFGRVAPQRPGAKPGPPISGPTILPALPAVYAVQTAIKARRAGCTWLPCRPRFCKSV